MVFLSVTVFGLLSYSRLPVTLMPELSYPTLTIRTEYPGAAPEEVENDISRPIEEQVGVINGLQRLSSVSRAGLSDVVLEFTWDTKMSDATQGVLEKMDQVLLPTEAERPLLLQFDPSLDPVMELSVAGTGNLYSGDAGLRRLRRLSELQIKRKLEPIKGVAAVRIRGGLEEEIHVNLEEDQLRRTGLSIQNVINRLAQENINVAGGKLKEGRTEYLVRTINEYESIDQIGDTIVATMDGRDVRVKDIGTVSWSNRDREILTRTDGSESVQIEVYKEGDANIVSLAKRVKEALGPYDPEAWDAEAAAPPAPIMGEGAGRGGPPQKASAGGLSRAMYEQENIHLQVVADRSLFIESSINEVRSTAILGGLLAVIVLFVFLRNYSSTMIVAISIPISLFITFAPLNIFGVSLNIMSLGGLALGIGMLVDSSIVVLESIFRCREEGDATEPAAVRGTAEVKGAVIASTLTSIAVFLPMVFVEGIAGQAFNDLGLAVVFSLLAATMVALYFIPMLASRGGLQLDSFRSGGGRRWLHFVSLSQFVESWSTTRVWLKPLLFPWFMLRLLIALVLETFGKIILLFFSATSWIVYRVLRPLISNTVKYLMWLPLKIFGGLMNMAQGVYPSLLKSALRHAWFVMVVFAFCIWVTYSLGTKMASELLPEVHQGEFTVEVSLPIGTPIERTDEILAVVEAGILEDREHIKTMILTVGYDPANSKRSDEGEHTAQFRVLLDSAGDPALEQLVIDRIRNRLAAVPDMDARVTRPVLFSSKTPIEVEVIGDDLVALKIQADRVQAVMETMPEVADVESTLRTGAPEVQIIYDRQKITRYGLNIQSVANLVRNKVKGFEATRFNMKDRRVPIIVRLEALDRESVQNITGLIVNPGADRPIPLSAVAVVTVGEGPSEVRRIDSRRTAVLAANLGSGALSSAVAAIERRLNRDVEWAPGTTFQVSGQNVEWERSRKSLVLALLLSVFLVYVIMAAQFESFVQPFIIMLTIPLAFFGSLLLLFLMGVSLSIVVFLGMIMLAGIVVNNAIVLVDYINTLRARGSELVEAVQTAGSVRLRPILMTTATTVLGLTPMALGLGDGAEIRTPMALAVIGGLMTSTALTLIIIPTFYVLIARLTERLFGRGQATAAVAPSIQADGVPS
jgi:HAE1 family hydrophobic/amphiphilic exporter-1